MSPKHEPIDAAGPDRDPRSADTDAAVEDQGCLAYRFDILRYSAGDSRPPHFQVYELTLDRKASVLEALLTIQDELDPSLAFRSACRGAVCGSCAMAVNGRLQLACRVPLQTIAGRKVVLEPLPGFEILKDLVVNMDEFWRKYERVQPWLHAELSTVKESLVTPQDQQRIDQFVNCILCGLCYAACPATRRNQQFTGPAALAKLQRFWSDSREDRDLSTVRQEDSTEGLWGCHTIMACCDVCPKEVRPADGIRGLRRRWFAERVKQFLGSRKNRKGQ
jgi:succinate dehydrogenase / fumarate reductase iron-sulfur subunit